LRSNGNFPRTILGAAAITIALICPAQTKQARSQPPAQAAPRLNFDVASIRERDPKDASKFVSVGMVEMPGRLYNQCADAASLIYFAYNKTSATPVIGLPSWTQAPCGGGFYRNTYEFEAKMPPDTTEQQERQMMQTLLADRFKLAVHWEKKNMQTYALVLAPGGFKLKPVGSNDQTVIPPDAARCPADDIACHRILGLSGPISDLAGMLATNVGRPIVDRTNLRSHYEINLKWASETATDSSLPALSTALREQLGLELRSEKASVDVLMVDHVEEPTPN
jgi:uncharacterized protein (TIGR03435 family)